MDSRKSALACLRLLGGRFSQSYYPLVDILRVSRGALHRQAGRVFFSEPVGAANARPLLPANQAQLALQFNEFLTLRRIQQALRDITNALATSLALRPAGAR